MKSALKVIFIIILLLILLISCNIARNFITVKKIIDLEESQIFDVDNYFINVYKQYNQDAINIEKYELFYDDAKYEIKESKNNRLLATYIYDYKTGEDNSFSQDNNKIEFKKELLDSYSLKKIMIIQKDVTIPNIVFDSIDCIVSENENYYIINRINNKKYYNKITGLLEKIEEKDLTINLEITLNKN